MPIKKTMTRGCCCRKVSSVHRRLTEIKIGCMNLKWKEYPCHVQERRKERIRLSLQESRVRSETMAIGLFMTVLYSSNASCSCNLAAFAQSILDLRALSLTRLNCFPVQRHRCCVLNLKVLDVRYLCCMCFIETVDVVLVLLITFKRFNSCLTSRSHHHAPSDGLPKLFTIPDGLFRVLLAST